MKVNTGPGGWKDGNLKVKVGGLWKGTAKEFVKKDGVWEEELSVANGDLQYESIVTVGSLTYGGTDYGYNFMMGAITQKILFGGEITGIHVNNYETPLYRKLNIYLIGNAVSQFNNVTYLTINGIRGFLSPGGITGNGSTTIAAFILESVPPLSGQWEVKIYGK